MKKLYLFLFTALLLQSNAQNEFSKWYFGANAGLDFITSPPTVLTNGMTNASEGVASIADNSGNLLFYTDGINVINANNALMANGSGLAGDGSSTQSAIIVKQPGSNTNYYIFTTPVGTGANNNARYSVVDMSLAAGLGSVTVKNVLMYNSTTEKQVAIRHCNGIDAWILSHKLGTNEFEAFLLTSTGLSSTPVISSIGNSINGFAVAGHFKISPDGKKLAVATFSNSMPSTLGIGGFHLFDFNAASGVVSNSLTVLSFTNIPAGGYPYGVEFSSDGTKLYGTTGTFTGGLSPALYQWNICASTTSAIVASQYSLGLGTLNVGAIQRAIDGKIYMAIANSNSLSVINNPNASGLAMGFSLNAVPLATNSICYLGLPNYINGYTHTTPALFTNTLNCQNAIFSVPPTPTFTNGCSPTPYLPSSYLWDFGEASSGTANTSTLTNPSHNYATTGTYTVSLIIYSPCINDTLKKVITVSTPGPAVSVAGNTVICKGDKYNYTASGATSYSWSTGSSNTSVALSPTNTTVYTVTGTAGACSTAKSFTVTVNPCTGISSLSDKESFNVFPNPFKDQLSIDAKTNSELSITDVSGAVVLTTKLNEGKNEINTSQLVPGIYLIQASNGEKVWRARFVKE